VDRLKDLEIDRSGSIAENTFLAIKDMIDCGTLPAGTVFANEIELGRMLQIGRSSLREAFTKLESINYIHRTKRGTQVADPEFRAKAVPLNTILRDSSMRDLIELRILIEQEVAAKAAVLATPQDIKTLKRCIERMEDSVDQIPVLCRYDAAFHTELARMSGNKLWNIIFSAIHEQLEEQIATAFEKDHSIIDRAMVFHARILAAIQNHNEELARTVMREHIENVKIVYSDEE